MRSESRDSGKLAVESAAFGAGYTAVLIWAGSALVSVFTPFEAWPYWPAVPRLRTDTAGVIAFVIAIVCLVVSKYLQLRRGDGGSAPGRRTAREPGAPGAPRAPRAPGAPRAPRSAGVIMVQAIAETAAVLATGLVIYLSLNAVTHPLTLRLQLTHLAPWPSEGTARVIALAVCLVAVATRRYLRASAPAPAQAPAVPERADIDIAR